MVEAERTVSSRRVYEGRILSLRVDMVTLPGGGQATREIVEHGESVVVVAVTDEDEVVLVRQYRHAVGQTLLEAPAGGLEKGESPEVAAAREMREDTGYEAEKLERLGGFWMAPGFCTEYMHVYLATGLTQGEATPEEDERIVVERVPLAKVRELIREGEIQDAKSVAALLMAVGIFGEGRGRR